MRPGPRSRRGPASGGASAARRRARRSSRLDENAAAVYAFLLGQHLDAERLARAIRVARRWRTRPHTVLIALGWVAAEVYAAALAHHLGLRLTSDPAAAAATTVVAALDHRPDELAALARSEAAAGRTVWLKMPGSPGSSRVAPIAADEAIEQATHGLERRRPELSAGTPVWLWQCLAPAAAAGLLAGGVAVAPDEALAVLLGLMALPFVLVTALRVLALWHLILPGRRPEPLRPVDRDLADATLPVYSVLVPLYDEADIIDELLVALVAIDYPADRLEVLIIIEASDMQTRARLGREPLPSHIRTLIVPPGAPRTKPRALNFALQHACGDFVVVYDAEDVPEPDQLRRAYDVLRARPEQVGCVQARLNIYNPKASWLSRGIMEQTPLAKWLVGLNISA